MKILFCLVILPSVYGILCHSPDGFIRDSMNTSLIIPLKHFIQKTLVPEEQKLCRIDITLRYPEIFVYIDFTNTFKDDKMINGDTILRTIVRKYEDTELQINSLQYACSTHDYCEIDFLFDYIYWLITEGYQETFVKNSAALLFGTGIELGRFERNIKFYFCFEKNYL